MSLHKVTMNLRPNKNIDSSDMKKLNRETRIMAKRAGISPNSIDIKHKGKYIEVTGTAATEKDALKIHNKFEGKMGGTSSSFSGMQMTTPRPKFTTVAEPALTGEGMGQKKPEGGIFGKPISEPQLGVANGGYGADSIQTQQKQPLNPVNPIDPGGDIGGKTLNQLIAENREKRKLDEQSGKAQGVSFPQELPPNEELPPASGSPMAASPAEGPSTEPPVQPSDPDSRPVDDMNI